MLEISSRNEFVALFCSSCFSFIINPSHTFASSSLSFNHDPSLSMGSCVTWLSICFGLSVSTLYSIKETKSKLCYNLWNHYPNDEQLQQITLKIVLRIMRYAIIHCNMHLAIIRSTRIWIYGQGKHFNTQVWFDIYWMAWNEFKHLHLWLYAYLWLPFSDQIFSTSPILFL